MTQLLKQAFQEASKLPDIQQNMIARWLLDELSVEKSGIFCLLNLKIFYQVSRMKL
ncbi:hypothetical protein [Chromatium okenii]|uniref:hypothetical protein n=1 Tax=Chromatium okenii TaxID=61644 RepID=UPI0026F07422|nr:hypothetical protein [Chromatium okenii]MBV5309437.1 hypothetical protein [Chromatium okenii]